MPPLVKFLARRLIAIPVTLFLITLVLYGVTMLAPAEVRASLYLPKHIRLESSVPKLLASAIERYGMNDPFPVQYGRWVSRLASGDWGYSPVQQQEVLAALLAGTPTTAELTLWSLVFFLPLGLLGGALAGSRQGRGTDRGIRAAAMVATSIPPFILGLVLLTVFYAGLHWLPAGRLSVAMEQVTQAPGFHWYTGLLTVDGLLNRRPDLTLDALRHLLAPVICLSLFHWATVARITRASLVEELGSDYVTAARARGLSKRALVWRHAFPNALGPALTSSGLAAASIVTGVFVVERVFALHGVSALMVSSMAIVPDTPMAVGVAVYSVLMVLSVMFVLDVIQAFIDPRIRRQVGEL